MVFNNAACKACLKKNNLPTAIYTYWNTIKILWTAAKIESILNVYQVEQK